MSKNFFFHSINIENFRGIEKLSMESLRRVNIIGGLNGVGKSTILEGVLLLLGRMNPLILSRPFISRQQKLPFPNGYNYVFNNYDTSKKVRIHGTAQTGSYEMVMSSESVSDVQISAQNVLQVANDVFSQSEQIKGIALKLSTNNKNLTDEMVYVQPSEDNIAVNVKSGNVARTPFGSYTSPSTFNHMEDAQRYSILMKERRTEPLLKHLRLLYGDLKSLQLLQESGAPVIYAEFSDNSMVQTALLGGGFQMMLSVALLMMTAKNGVFLFDEVDNTIHHSLLKDFWASVSVLASETNGQVFAVTHSRECIGAAVQGFSVVGKLSDLAYFRLEERLSETKCVCYDSEDLKEALSSDWEMR